MKRGETLERLGAHGRVVRESLFCLISASGEVALPVLAVGCGTPLNRAGSALSGQKPNPPVNCRDVIRMTRSAIWQFYSIASITERMWKSRTGLWWTVPRNLGFHLALRNFGRVGFNPA
jgi:hypothetical protein